MSKEQTYITAEDYINSQDNFLGRDWRNDDKELAKAFKEFSKHNEEAKVLEALEREVPKAYHRGRIDASLDYLNGISIEDLDKIEPFKEGKEYYETEVKPNYVKSI